MGHHLVNAEREYQLLQRRYDRELTGAPESPVFTEILKLLYTPEQAELARKLPPIAATSLDVLTVKLGIPKDELDGRLTEMARKGLILDLDHNGQRYFTLPPVVIGLLEHVFMYTRGDIPQRDLARLFEEYMNGNDRFYQGVFEGKTQLTRALVREEALPKDDHAEVLDWERASRILESAPMIGVSLCTCRHMAAHLGKACDRPQETCLALDYPAEAAIRNGRAKQITVAEAMRILEECREAGLAQIGDNIQRKVKFICNCCGCCCYMLEPINNFNMRNTVVTSNWIMEIEASRCNGCGLCIEACPTHAITIIEETKEEKKQKMAARNETLCLGCGVCYSACKRNGLRMKPRAQRVYTPETVLEHSIVMAIERGKLCEFMFSDPEKLNYRVLGRIMHAIENSPPSKAMMAIKPLKSVFLTTMVKGAKTRSKEIASLVT